ncbi:hypothetical protein KUTeg_019223 [Tegillarca granosa]|uniref:Proteasome assembly chaperone 2 n=1 Tax=Tegillarca granosa TaxID=220873 RepID=A0ABQ9EBY0_TEGGR|nr:hypothetical protein KUTeg_019223 [Tegillarca granosa]
MFVPSDQRQRKLEEYSLVVPAVSVGNVGQLAADLLISTLWMERIGYIHHQSILPVVGNDPFAHRDSKTCKVVTSCEVYESLEHKLIVVQQRAPFVKGKLSQFRFLASPLMEKELGEVFRSTPLNWQELERRSSFPAPTPAERSENGTSSNEQIYLPGGGIAKSLFEDLSKDLPVIVMSLFCSEGDNAQDGFKMVNYLNDWLKLIYLQPRRGNDGKMMPAQEWKTPVSWKLLYGTRMDQTLFH